MKILILTSYTGKKRSNPPNPITREDCTGSRAHYKRRIEELAEYSVPAGKMFIGHSHRDIREGLRQIRGHEQYGQTKIDQYFPSHYYRVDLEKKLVHENDEIVPFNIEPCSDNYGETAHPDRIQALIEDDALVFSLLEKLIEGYDLVFSLLEKYHFLPLRHLFQNQCQACLVLLVAPSWNIPESPRIVPVGEDLVGKVERASRHNLRGSVFRKLCKVACHEGFQVFEQIKRDPQRLLEIAITRGAR